MRTLILSILVCASCFSAEVKPPEPVRDTTEADLQNLVACARMALPSLTAEQIAAVAVAIKHAEDDVKAMRKAQAAMPPPPAEAKK